MRNNFNCNFCLKDSYNVKVLVVAENDTGICAKCIEIAYDSVAKKLNTPTISQLKIEGFRRDELSDI